jgi:hypothetical protein
MRWLRRDAMGFAECRVSHHELEKHGHVFEAIAVTVQWYPMDMGSQLFYS